MTDTQFVQACVVIIERCDDRTKQSYITSVNEFNRLYNIAENKFQQDCVIAAHSRLWSPFEPTLINLFDNIGRDLEQLLESDTDI